MKWAVFLAFQKIVTFDGNFPHREKDFSPRRFIEERKLAKIPFSREKKKTQQDFPNFSNCYHSHRVKIHESHIEINFLHFPFTSS